MKIPASLIALPQSCTLDNGMRVFFRKTLPSGLVSVQVWVKSGSIHEAEFLGGGLSHFLEHTVFKGTEKFSADELSRRVHDVGGNANAYTTFSRTVFYIDVPAEAAAVAFELLAQMTQHPTLDAADIAREKDVILREIDMSRDDPDSRLFEASLAEIFRVHPYRVPVIGRKNIFAEMTERELRTYFRRRYTPENSALVVAGDIAAGTVFSLAEKFFGNEPERAAADVFVPAEPPQLAPRNATLRGDVNVLRGSLSWKIPGFAHADTPAISVLAALLGNGDSARLHRELHEKRSLVHEIDAYAWAPRDVGLFRVSYVADLGRRAETEAAVLAEIRKIAAHGVEPKALKKASRIALSALVNSLATAGAAAARLGSECVECDEPSITRIFLEKISALAPDDIQRVAATYLRAETRTCAAFESAKNPESARPAVPVGTAGKSVGVPAGKTEKSDANAAPANAAATDFPGALPTVSAQKSASTGTFPPFEEISLASGVRVLLQPVRGLPKVHLRAAMLAGGSFENEKIKGASALLSALLTLDAGGRKAEKIAEEIESVGGRFDEISGNNSISLSAETLSGDEALACRILGDALAEPDFSAANFRRERAAQLAELRSDFDEIEDFAFFALRREFFGAHALGVRPYGTETALGALRLDDVRALCAALVVPANIVLAASGEFDRDALLGELEKNFSPERFARDEKSSGGRRAKKSSTAKKIGVPDANSVAASGTNFLAAFEKFSPRNAREIELSAPVPAEQAIVQIAFPDVGLCDERYRVGTLVNELLSGMSSRLFLEVRERRGLAYFVGSSRLGALAAGMFYLCAGTEKTKAPLVLDEMRREMARLRAGDVSADELAAAKTRICVAQRTRRQRAATRCGNASLDVLYGLAANRDAEEEAKLAALEVADVARFASEILAPETELALVVR